MGSETGEILRCKFRTNSVVSVYGGREFEASTSTYARTVLVDLWRDYVDYFGFSLVTFFFQTPAHPNLKPAPHPRMKDAPSPFG